MSGSNTERSPLLLSRNSSTTSDQQYYYHDDDDDDDDDISRRRHEEHTLSSERETALNLMKTCMGTGCLALPFACQQGGLVLFAFGLAAIALWNVYSVQRLISCLQFLPTRTSGGDESTTITTTSTTSTTTTATATNVTTDEETVLLQQPSASASSASASASATASPSAAPPADISMLGKVAWYAYGPIGVEVLDVMMMILLLGVIVAYFCAILTFLHDTPFRRFWGDIGDGIVTAVILTTISMVPHIGVLSHASALGLTVLLVTFIVIFGYGFWQEEEEGDDDDKDVSIQNDPSPSLAVWPQSRQGLSHWFGVVVFGFGIVPMTYNYHASMRRPGRMVQVTACAMGLTALSYLIAGVGLYALFPSLQGDVLSELPKTGLLPVLTRLAMVVVVLMTAPLIVVPLSELLQGKWQRQEIWMIRLGICALSCVVAVAYPDFVRALSLVGSTCVAAVSFIIPPVLHSRLVWLQRRKITKSNVLDAVMLALGVVLTVASTIYNLQ